MAGFLVFIGLIASFSIFCFFGDAFSNTGGYIVPNMFHLMFGLKQNELGYSVTWKRYPGLTLLFSLQIIIIIFSIVVFCSAINSGNNKKDNGGRILCVLVLGFLSLVAAILSFCTIGLTGSDISSSSGVGLGIGPILYSSLQLLVVVLSIFAITVMASVKPSLETSQGSSNNYSNGRNESPKHELNEIEKADLILKYKKMLDDGIITQEEFEKKKKELLE